MSDSGRVPLVVVGGGNMGAALVGGIIEAGVVSASDITVVEIFGDRRAALADLLPGVTISADVPAAGAGVVAVKPGDAPEAAAALAAAGASRVLSIAAGVTISALQDAVGPGVAVVRAMPNTPALVGLGAAAIAPGSTATDADLDWATSMLGAVGIVEQLQESQLDLFTGLAGSGPAYVFLVAEALIDAAVAEGLARPVAERVVQQLLLGSSALLARDGDPARLRANVTSPGGTTAAGLARLEERSVRAAFADAVRGATERSRELG